MPAASLQGPMPVCDRIENSDRTGTGPDWDHFDRNGTRAGPKPDWITNQKKLTRSGRIDQIFTGFLKL